MTAAGGIRVLLIDDDPVTVAVIRGYLQPYADDYRLRVVERHDHALEEATAGAHDLVLLDECLGHHTAAQVLLGLTQRGCRVPILVLTHRRDRDFAWRLRELGAGEVLVRGDLSPDSLDRNLRHTHRERQDQHLLEAWVAGARTLPAIHTGPCALIEPAGTLDAPNAAWCELFGRSRIESTGCELAELLVATSGPGRGATTAWSTTARVPGGEVPVRCTAVALPQGRRLLALEIGEDSRRILRRLSAAPEEATLLRHLIASLPDQVYLKDRQARFVLNSPAHLAVLGAPDQAATVGRTDHDFFPPELADAFRADDRLVIDGGQVILDKIERIRHVDGSLHWVSVSKAPLRDEHGHVIGLVGMSRDITGRMGEAQALAEQQRRIAALVSAAPVVLYSFDARGIITLSEGAGLAGLGLHPGELVGRSIFQTYADVPAVGDLCRRAIAGERVSVEDVAVGDRHFSVWMDPTRDDMGQVREVIGVSYDITEEHHARADLQLRDSAFLQAQKMEAVGRLAGGVAHDFNNLLTAILGHAELLGERLDQERDRASAHQIAAVARKGSAMTRRLLAFCRRQSPEPAAVDLHEVVRSATELASPLLGDGVRIQLALPGAGLTVLGDEVQLEQVLLNLLVNARDAMDGSGTITIAASCERGEVLLSLSDTGCGMDEATLARCRDPFFTTKGEDQGTGLGLATVSDILHQSGGRCELISRPGEGCTVFITLPAIEAGRPRDASHESTAAHATVALPRRVVVAEDQADVRSMLGEILTQLEVEVVECRDGLAAWHLLDTDPAPCDLLVTDINMPGIDGTELARRVARRHPDLPILFISGHAEDPGDLPEGPHYGLLAKPFSRSQLVRHLGRLARSPAP